MVIKNMNTKFYAVKKGKNPGIYRTWIEAKNQVDHVSGAEYKSFNSKPEAEKWMYEKKINRTPLSSKDMIHLYVDGGSRNTGNKQNEHVKKYDKAAWAYLIRFKSYNVSYSEGERGATNNKMELTAVIRGLETIGEEFGYLNKIQLISDSKYFLDAVNKKWLNSWHKNNWKKKDGQQIANLDLWKKIWNLLNLFEDNINFTWTKGHDRNEGNIEVDKLLNITMDNMK